MSVETKSVTIEVKAEGEGIIEAYAATFNGVDSVGDTIKPGAFTKSITERGPSGSRRIKALLNHEMTSLPIGTPQHMQEDAYGLMTATKMSGTQMARDIYTLAKEGAITELSIGYQPVQSTKADGSGGIYRVLNEIKLFEYSFLTVPPADERALITSIKSFSDLEAEIRRWTAIAEIDLKAGRILSGVNAKRIRNALKELQDLVSAAGLDTDEEAADSTSASADSTTTDTKNSTEPPKPAHSLLTALQHEAKRLSTEGKGGALLSELRNFSATLYGGTP